MNVTFNAISEPKAAARRRFSYAPRAIPNSKKGIYSKMSGANVNEETEDDDLKSWQDWIGQRVSVSGVKFGTLRYFGTTHFSDGFWCGIELDEAVGKNNGTVKGVKYFTCKEKCGIFAPLSRTSKLLPQIEPVISKKQKIPQTVVKKGIPVKNGVQRQFSDISPLSGGLSLSRWEKEFSDHNSNMIPFAFTHRALDKRTSTPLNASYNVRRYPNQEPFVDILNQTVTFSNNGEILNIPNENDRRDSTFHLIDKGCLLNATFDSFGIDGNTNDRRQTTFTLHKQSSEEESVGHKDTEGVLVRYGSDENLKSADFDESLGILTPSQMKDFTVNFETPVIPDTNAKISKMRKIESCDEVCDLPEFELDRALPVFYPHETVVSDKCQNLNKTAVICGRKLEDDVTRNAGDSEFAESIVDEGNKLDFKLKEDNCRKISDICATPVNKSSKFSCTSLPPSDDLNFNMPNLTSTPDLSLKFPKHVPSIKQRDVLLFDLSSSNEISDAMVTEFQTYDQATNIKKSNTDAEIRNIKNETFPAVFTPPTETLECQLNNLSIFKTDLDVECVDKEFITNQKGSVESVIPVKNETNPNTVFNISLLDSNPSTEIEAASDTVPNLNKITSLAANPMTDSLEDNTIVTTLPPVTTLLSGVTKLQDSENSLVLCSLSPFADSVLQHSNVTTNQTCSLPPFVDSTSLLRNVASNQTCSLPPFVDSTSLVRNVANNQICSLSPFVESASPPRSVTANDICSLSPFVDSRLQHPSLKTNEVCLLSPFVDTTLHPSSNKANRLAGKPIILFEKFQNIDESVKNSDIKVPVTSCSDVISLSLNQEDLNSENNTPMDLSEKSEKASKVLNVTDDVPSIRESSNFVTNNCADSDVLGNLESFINNVSENFINDVPQNEEVSSHISDKDVLNKTDSFTLQFQFPKSVLLESQPLINLSNSVEVTESIPLNKTVSTESIKCDDDNKPDLSALVSSVTRNQGDNVNKSLQNLTDTDATKVSNVSMEVDATASCNLKLSPVSQAEMSSNSSWNSSANQSNLPLETKLNLDRESTFSKDSHIDQKSNEVNVAANNKASMQPKKNVVSKIKLMLQGNKDQNQENVNARNTSQKKLGKWDAVTSKIAAGLSDNKTKQKKKDVTSKVNTNLAGARTTATKGTPHGSSKIENLKKIPAGSSVGSKNTSYSPRSNHHDRVTSNDGSGNSSRILIQLQNVDSQKSTGASKGFIPPPTKKRGFFGKPPVCLTSPTDSVSTIGSEMTSSGKIPGIKKPSLPPKVKNTVTKRGDGASQSISGPSRSGIMKGSSGTKDERMRVGNYNSLPKAKPLRKPVFQRP